MTLTEALATIKAQSDLTDAEYKDLCQIVANRLVPSTTQPVCGAPEQSWSMPKVSSWLTQHDLAKVLGIPAVNVRQWQIRGKLPQPDDHVNGRPVWSRKRVREFCDDLVELAT